ncbi:MAG: PIN domain-containing protein [Candidatus Nanopelagicales bacterium]
MRRTYVLDTSVLLSDPNAITRFDEHEVVLPLVVVTELEAKRTHSELGYFARQALRLLDDLRISHGRLDEAVPLPDGGTLRVELNHSDLHVLPSGFQSGDNDSRILAVAQSLSNEGNDVVLVSKDLPMRVKASAMGLGAEEYRAELAVTSGWTGISEVAVTTTQIDELYDTEVLELDEARDLPCHTGLVLYSDRGSALGRVTPNKQVQLIRGDREAFGLHGRSAEQRIALDLLLDPDIGIVSLGGRAGTVLPVSGCQPRTDVNRIDHGSARMCQPTRSRHCQPRKPSTWGLRDYGIAAGKPSSAASGETGRDQLEGGDSK